MSQIHFSLLTYFSLCFPNYFGNIKKGKTACILCRISRQLRKENNRTLYFCCSFLDVKCPPYLANAIFSIAHPPTPSTCLQLSVLFLGNGVSGYTERSACHCIEFLFIGLTFSRGSL